MEPRRKFSPQTLEQAAEIAFKIAQSNPDEIEIFPGHDGEVEVKAYIGDIAEAYLINRDNTVDYTREDWQEDEILWEQAGLSVESAKQQIQRRAEEVKTDVWRTFVTLTSRIGASQNKDSTLWPSSHQKTVREFLWTFQSASTPSAKVFVNT
jgi:hypothetical protein